MRALCAADIGINSTLSEYNRDLFEQYDLLFTDMTYGGGSGSIEAVRSHLKYYLAMNLDEGTPDMCRDLLGMRLKDAVIEEIASVIAKEKERGEYSAVMIETALLYEAGIDGMCDEVWFVYAPEGTRRTRLMEIRGYSPEKTDMFLRNQQPEEEFLRRADRTVPNGADVTEKDMVHIISAYLGEGKTNG